MKSYATELVCWCHVLKVSHQYLHNILPVACQIQHALHNIMDIPYILVIL